MRQGIGVHPQHLYHFRLKVGFGLCRQFLRHVSVRLGNGTGDGCHRIGIAAD